MSEIGDLIESLNSMAKVIAEKVVEDIDAGLSASHAKMSTALIVRMFSDLQKKQSEDTQRLERALQVAETTIERFTERVVECEKEMAWLKTGMAKQESRIDDAARYVKTLGNGKQTT